MILMVYDLYYGDMTERIENENTNEINPASVSGHLLRAAQC